MIHLFKTCMITAFILGLTWSAPLRAQDQRYISIRNTDTSKRQRSTVLTLIYW